MRMRKGHRLAIPIVLGMLLAVLAACSSDDSGGENGGGSGGGPTTTAASGPTTSAPAAAELPRLDGQRVTVLGKWSGDEQAAFEQVIADFERRTGADVTYSSGGDNIATVLGTAIQGGSPPDVAILPQPGLLTDLARANRLQEVSGPVSQLVDKNYAPSWRDLGTVDGKLYGVWFKAANKSTVWYRTDLFDAAGVKDPPKTWDDFLDTARNVSASGVTPISVGGADGWTLTDWFENVYLRSAGPDRYDQLSRHQIPWTDPSVTDAMDMLGQIWGDPTLLSGGTATALQNDFTQSVVRVFSPDNQAAIVFEGDFVAGVITKNTTFKPGDRADFFPFPSIGGSAGDVVGGGDVAARLTTSPAGEAFLEYLAMPESAEVWAKQGGFTSPNKDVDTSLYPDDITRRSAEQLVGADTFRFDLSDLQPAAFGATEGQGMWGLFQKLLGDSSQTSAVAQQLEQAATAAYGG